MEKNEKLNATFEAVKRAVSGDGVKVTCGRNEKFKSVGVVSVVGKNIEIKDPALFSAASEIASNLEVYPKTDGTVVMSLTFHHLTQE